MNRFTSHIGFSLTIKRFVMMRKKNSLFNHVVRSFSTIPLILALSILFCSAQNPKELYIEVPNIGSIYTDQKLWFNFYEYSQTGGAIPKSPAYVDEQRKPFTGVSNIYREDDNTLLSKSLFKDGFRTEWINYLPSGEEIFRLELEYQNKEWVSSRIFSKSVIKTEWLSPETTGERYGKMNEFHENGSLKLELLFSWKDEIKHEIVYQDIMTLYDESGRIVGQELYKDGELVEKIK